jgi:hypothetical protein
MCAGGEREAARLVVEAPAHLVRLVDADVDAYGRDRRVERLARGNLGCAQPVCRRRARPRSPTSGA